MKSLLVFFLSAFLLVSCFTKIDDTGKSCSSNCTKIKGRFTTSDGQPIQYVKILLESRYSIGVGAYYRKIANGITDENGEVELNVYINDTELKYHLHTVVVNDSLLNPNKYLLARDVSQSDFFSQFTLPKISRRDTTIGFEYIIPEKSYLDITIKDFDTTGANKFNGLLDAKYGYVISDTSNKMNFDGIHNHFLFTAHKGDRKVSVAVPRYQQSILKLYRNKNNVETLDSIFIQPSLYKEEMMFSF